MPDPAGPVGLVLQSLDSGQSGLTTKEAERRLRQFGENRIERAAKRGRGKELLRQFTHPLAILLWVASGLAWLSGAVPIAVAIVTVIFINALFAFSGGPLRDRLDSGDGGSRTRVRSCAESGVYECVRCSDLVPGSPHRRGYLGPVLLVDVPGSARSFLTG